MPTAAAAKHRSLPRHQHQQHHHLYPQQQHHNPHQQGGEEHKDAWHQFEGLVFALIFIHVAAFAFWCYLLYKSRAARVDAAAKGKGAPGSGSAAAGAAAGAVGPVGKSPKDILKAYQKAQLGKA